MSFDVFIINDEIIFDVNANELQPVAGNGDAVILNAPTARCLQLLLESTGKVVPREEFMEVVWKARGIVVSENTFYQNISLLRKSLARAGLSHEIIVTIRQRGFVIAEGTVIKVISHDDEFRGFKRVNLAKDIHDGNEMTLPGMPIELSGNSDLVEKSDTNSSNKRISFFRLPIWTFILVSIMTIINIFDLFL